MLAGSAINTGRMPINDVHLLRGLHGLDDLGILIACLVLFGFHGWTPVVKSRHKPGPAFGQLSINQSSQRDSRRTRAWLGAQGLTNVLSANPKEPCS